MFDNSYIPDWSEREDTDEHFDGLVVCWFCSEEYYLSEFEKCPFCGRG